jgi:hypothetical protein
MGKPRTIELRGDDIAYGAPACGTTRIITGVEVYDFLREQIGPHLP